MYTQIFLVTSVRGRVLAPQIVAIIAELLRGEDALPRLLHGGRILLGCSRARNLASLLLLGRDLLQSRLRDRRLRGLRHRGLRNRLGSSRHRDRGKKVQTRLEPPC